MLPVSVLEVFLTESRPKTPNCKLISIDTSGEIICHPWFNSISLILETRNLMSREAKWLAWGLMASWCHRQVRAWPRGQPFGLPVKCIHPSQPTNTETSFPHFQPEPSPTSSPNIHCGCYLPLPLGLSAIPFQIFHLFILRKQWVISIEYKIMLISN